ncbi:MAG: hypothetical protein KY460_10990, partial [Actinobacteria bacterium]|nr:hypothetical protein [Actinomycetota bacterium]
GAGTGNRTPDLLITSYQLSIVVHGDDWPLDVHVCVIIAATSSTSVRLLTLLPAEIRSAV